MMEDDAKSDDFAQRFAQLETLVKPYMTRDAMTRYGNLRVAHPQVCIKAMVYLAKMIDAKRISEVDDKTFKMVLMRLQESKRESNISFR